MSKTVRLIQFNELLLDRLRSYASRKSLTVDFVIAVAVDQYLDAEEGITVPVDPVIAEIGRRPREKQWPR